MDTRTIYTQSGVFPVTTEDMVVSPWSAYRAGVNDPSIATYKTDFKVISFHPTTNNEVFFDLQVPHARKPDSSLAFHTHFTLPTTPTNGNTVGWKLTYSLANIGGSFPTSATLDLTYTCDGTEGNDEHLMSNIVKIDGDDIMPSAIIKCKLWRDATNDSYGYAAYLHSIDFHFYRDRLGGRIV